MYPCASKFCPRESMPVTIRTDFLHKNMLRENYIIIHCNDNINLREEKYFLYSIFSVYLNSLQFEYLRGPPTRTEGPTSSDRLINR